MVQNSLSNCNSRRTTFDNARNFETIEIHFRTAFPSHCGHYAVTMLSARSQLSSCGSLRSLRGHHAVESLRYSAFIVPINCQVIQLFPSASRKQSQACRRTVCVPSRAIVRAICAPLCAMRTIAIVCRLCAIVRGH